MAYKPVQYDFFNPMEELVPLVLIYNKAYQALDKKYEEYMDWLSSSSELLNRDEGAKALKEKYQNDLNIMADALAKGDLRTAHSVDPRKYWYPLKTKQKRAEYLSKHIEDQSKRGSKYAFSKRYDINTPLDENITEAPDWQEYDLNDYVKKGISIGKELNSTAPLQVGSLFNGALALLRQGVSLEEVYDLLTRSDSELSLRIDDEIRATGITDPIELLKIRNAMGNGILQSVGQSIETHNDPNNSPAEKRAARKFEREELEEDAIRYYRRTGDYSKLEELGLAREYKNSKDNLVVEIGNHSYTVKYLDSSNQDELRKIAIANNPALAKEENRSKLDEAVSNMIDLLKKGKAIKVAGGLTRDSQELSDRKIQNEVLKAVKEDIENKYGKGYEIVHSPNQELYYAYKEEKKSADSGKSTKTFYVVRRGEHGETLGMYRPDRTELIKALMDMYYTKDEIVDAVANSCWENDKNLKKYKGQDAKNAWRLYAKDIESNYVIPIMEGKEPISIEDDALDDKQEEGSEEKEGDKYGRNNTKRLK